jgi:wyosine [tRNA(Phe)-imidazoG37] synthetase (radical SAM superfamily)
MIKYTVKDDLNHRKWPNLLECIKPIGSGERRTVTQMTMLKGVEYTMNIRGVHQLLVMLYISTKCPTTKLQQVTAE